MKAQVQIQKMFENMNFLTSTIYDRYDLRNKIRPYEKLIVRQGDLIISSRPIFNYRERGLAKAYLKYINGYYVFRESHMIIPLGESIAVYHNEHGVVLIPLSFESLNFYTFRDSYD